MTVKLFLGTLASLFPCVAMIGQVEPGAVGTWLIIFVGLLVGVNVGLEIWNKVKNRGGVEFATLDHVNRLEQDVQRNREDILGAIGRVESQVTKVGESAYKGRKSLYGQVARNRDALSFLAGKLSAEGDAIAAGRIRELTRLPDDEGS